MRLTAEMLGTASPLKPRVPTCKRSSPVETLLVAWRSRHMSRSSRSMPQPSSTTRISDRPAASTCTAILDAPASMAFSRQLLQHAGRALHHLSGGDLVGHLLGQKAHPRSLV